MSEAQCWVSSGCTPTEYLNSGNLSARALIAETNLILADEPTGNLDYKTSKEIFSYFLKFKKLKKTIIFATHNRELANRADYKLFISNGDIKRVNAR